MSYRNSVTNVPRFWGLVLGIGFLLFSTMYVGFETGGIIGSIPAELYGIYNLLYGCIFVTQFWASSAWTFFKWDIIIGIGTPAALFIWSFVPRKRR